MVYGNFIIDGNHTDYGITTNGTTTTTYTYDRILHIDADVVVVNNFFAGIKDDVTKSMVFVNDTRSHITKNTFTRGNSNILAYIYFKPAGTKNSVITENAFDQATVDGTDENLVKNNTEGTIYERNVNQTAYAFYSLLNHDGLKHNPYYTVQHLPDPAYPMKDNRYQLDVHNMDYYTDPLTFNANTSKRAGVSLATPNNTNYLAFLELSTNTIGNDGMVHFGKMIDLDTVLPKNVQILNAMVNIATNCQATGSVVASSITYSGDAFIRIIKRDSSSVMSPATVTSDSVLMESGGDAALDHNKTGTNALTTVNYPISVTPSINTYINSYSSNIRLYFTVYFNVSSIIAAHYAFMRISPIRIKYRWI